MEYKEESPVQIKGKLECGVCKQEIFFTGYVCDNCRVELNKKAKKHFEEEIRSRFDGYGYALFLFLFAGTSYCFVEGHGWNIAIFIFVLETVILELAYRLSNR